MASVVVVGAGVSGLTCATELAEAGHRVRVIARDRSPDTTSDVAAAVWYPLRGARDPRVEGWLRASYERFAACAEDPRAGILMRGGMELFRAPADDDWWRDILPGFRRARPEELPPGYGDAFVTEGLPVVEMPAYLPWLTARSEARGVTFEHRVLSSLDEVLGDADVVVNCSGLGARELCGDDSVYPVRGQVVRVVQFGLERFVFDEDHPDGVVYILPRSRDVVLGGTRQENEWSLEVDPATERAIIERCAVLEPRVREAAVLSRAVGLRPGRVRVRLEAETRDGTLVVHDYGHGGSGVTLSWGCALEVADLIARG